ncbi:MAG: DNA ligase D [Opitutales bacterium]
MLKEYQQKRNFDRTNEPAGNGEEGSNKPFFVVQEHDASSHHYDFRFLHNGALKSWAVPKGPSLNPSDKRLAIAVEDHPVDYADFEGTIPEGEYGAGSVLVWDQGEFKPLKDLDQGLEEGQLQFALEGKKLRGEFEMVRLKNADDNDQWLLIKHRDRYARNGRSKPITEKAPQSVKSGRTIREIGKASGGANGVNGLPLKPRAEAQSRKLGDPEKLEGAKRSRFPTEVQPALPKLTENVPEGDDWIHEIKWDGYRLLAEKRGGKLRLLTRNRADWTDRFATIARELDQTCEQDFIFDGEVVFLDDNGHSNFQGLQQVIKQRSQPRLFFYLFDALYFDGVDLRGVPLTERKDFLHQLFSQHQHMKLLYSDHIHGDAQGFHQKACDEKLEGVVSKRAPSAYQSGRTASWLKTKCNQQQEAIIVGWTPPGGKRPCFGSLLLGAFNDDGNLTYIGRVGTGFDHDTLNYLFGELQKIARKTSPIEVNPEHVPDNVNWVTPTLVAEIAFTQVTKDGLLRHPSFQGLREDKPASEVGLDLLKQIQAPKPGSSPEAAPKKEARAVAQPAEKVAKKAAPRSRKKKPVSRNTEPEIEVTGVSISHADRVIEPESGITKGDLARYYGKAAEVILNYCHERPLSVVRCPEGIGGDCFFQKHFDGSVPSHVETIALPEKEGKGKYCFLREQAGVVSLAQYGGVELHGWGSRIDYPEKPDNLIFDLDPDDSVAWEETLGAAFLLRDMLGDIGLRAWAKLTGGKGLHVCVPVTRRVDWEDARDFCHRMALAVVSQNPKKFVAKANKQQRKGKIFIDYLRNAYGATAILPYAVRSKPGMPVAMPVGWDELDASMTPDYWTIDNSFERIESAGRGPWADYLRSRQTLTKARLDAIRNVEL